MRNECPSAVHLGIALAGVQVILSRGNQRKPHPLFVVCLDGVQNLGKITFTGEDSPMSNLLLSVMGAFAQFERELIRERQREGIAIAKRAGKYRGRKPVLTAARGAELRKRVATGESKAGLAREFGISRDTLYRHLAVAHQRSHRSKVRPGGKPL